MDFAYNEEQQMLRDSVERFGDEAWNLADRLKHLAEGPAGTKRRWHQMAELGWLMLPLSEEAGGLGGGPVEVMAIMEGMGRYLMTEAYVSQCVLPLTLLQHAAADFAPLIEQITMGGACVAVALLEEGGFGSADIAAQAEQDSDGGGDVYRLSGAKMHVEDGADADYFIVSARTSGEFGAREGVGLFLVPSDAAGLTVQRFRSVDGHRHASLLMDKVAAVPVGDVATAADRIDAAVGRALVAHMAEAVGSMEAAAAATLEYARTREQFGAAIGSFQVVQHKLVDMHVACEEARAIMMVAAGQLASGAIATNLLSAAKVRVAQCGVQVAQQAVQLHGGVGTSDELVVSHHLRRQMMLELAHGDSEHYRSRFADHSF